MSCRQARQATHPVGGGTQRVHRVGHGIDLAQRGPGARQREGVAFGDTGAQCQRLIEGLLCGGNVTRPCLRFGQPRQQRRPAVVGQVGIAHQVREPVEVAGLCKRRGPHRRGGGVGGRPQLRCAGVRGIGHRQGAGHCCTGALAVGASGQRLGPRGGLVVPPGADQTRDHRGGDRTVGLAVNQGTLTEFGEGEPAFGLAASAGGREPRGVGQQLPLGAKRGGEPGAASGDGAGLVGGAFEPRRGGRFNRLGRG